MQGEDRDTVQYMVVMNHEEQYSIWPADQEVPDGWTRVGEAAPKADCLTYIEQAWTDMRPRSLRLAMSGHNEHAS